MITLEKNKSKNPFFIGLLSFFGGVSQDIFVPVLPLYLANVLHMEKSLIGISEGLVTFAASLFRMLSGYLSDKLKKNKAIVFVGYACSLVSRPLLALAVTPPFVFFLRFLDGVGKGVKDTPKDALIADSTLSATRGRSFGVVRALDTFGSVVGPILLFLLLYMLKDNKLKYHYIFFITAIPLFITLSILTFFVKEISVTKISEPGIFKQKNTIPRSFYLFLVAVTIFSLGNSSDSFLILRAQNVGVGLLAIPLVYALFNFVYASASIPLGSLSDKIGRKKVIIMGWLSYSLAYYGFSVAHSPIQIWFLFGFYGIYYATTEGVAKALIADLVNPLIRGRAYGIYNSVVGIITLPASFFAGFLWDKISPSAPFFLATILSLFATALLVFIRV